MDSVPLDYRYLAWDTPLPELKLAENADTDSPTVPPPSLKAETNPREYSPAHKNVLMGLSCISTMMTAYGQGGYDPGVTQYMAYWNIGEVPAQLGITLTTLGFAMAPLFLAPFSEINGRKPVFLVCGFLYAVFVLFCAVTHVFWGMLVSRFLVGCAASTFSTIIGGIVADLYPASKRNTPMTVFSMFVFFGSGLGPLISGFIAYNTTWRWIFYSHAISLFVLSGALIIWFDETRSDILLSKKARKINKWYEQCEAQNQQPYAIRDDLSEEKPLKLRWKVKADEDRDGFRKMIWKSISRPIYLFFTEPVVFFFSCWLTFAWSILFALYDTIPYAFEVTYGFNLQQQNLIFVAVMTGAVIFMIIVLLQDYLSRGIKKLHSTPESRLYFACVESALLPIGLFMFGWTVRPEVPWIVPAIAIGIATIGICSVYLAVFNYLADAYQTWASSAMAAQTAARNTLAGCWPLFTVQMFKRMGFGGAGSFLGGLGLLLTAVPWVLVMYGPRIRARSKICSEFIGMESPDNMPPIKEYPSPTP